MHKRSLSAPSPDCRSTPARQPASREVESVPCAWSPSQPATDAPLARPAPLRAQSLQAMPQRTSPGGDPHAGPPGGLLSCFFGPADSAPAASELERQQQRRRAREERRERQQRDIAALAASAPPPPPLQPVLLAPQPPAGGALPLPLPAHVPQQDPSRILLCADGYALPPARAEPARHRPAQQQHWPPTAPPPGPPPPPLRQPAAFGGSSAPPPAAPAAGPAPGPGASGADSEQLQCVTCMDALREVVRVAAAAAVLLSAAQLPPLPRASSALSHAAALRLFLAPAGVRAVRARGALLGVQRARSLARRRRAAHLPVPHLQERGGRRAAGVPPVTPRPADGPRSRASSGSRAQHDEFDDARCRRDVVATTGGAWNGRR